MKFMEVLLKSSCPIPKSSYCFQHLGTIAEKSGVGTNVKKNNTTKVTEVLTV